MITMLDFSKAVLSTDPVAYRDGGSIKFSVLIDNQEYGVRYAGSIADTMNNIESKIEIFDPTMRHNQYSYFDADEIVGWAQFISRNAEEFGKFKEILLRPRKRTQEQIDALKNIFKNR